MSARVYLMADFGKGPRALTQYGRTVPLPGEIVQPVRDETDTAARAWWLVEAASAEAARDVIARGDGTLGSHVAFGGRILASGGQR